MMVAAALGMAADRALTAEKAVVWATGPTLQQRLGDPVDIVWSENPLRSALRGLSRAQHVALMLDRRVDPSQQIEIKLSTVPLAAVFQEIARNRRLGMAMVGPVAYFAPMNAASRIRTVVALRDEEVRRLGPGGARPFTASKPLSWADYVTPRDVLGKLAEENGVELVGLERVPHDLWAGVETPALPWLERFTLVLNQFDLTFEVLEDARRVAIVPLPATVAIVRSYAGGSDPARTAERFLSLVPNAQIKVVGDKVYVRGWLEDHERIGSPRVASADVPRAGKSPAAKGEIMISRLAVQEKPVGKVLEQLAAKLKFELKIDREALKEAGVDVDQRVSIEVENATIDVVLRELLKSTPMTHRRRGGVVEIVPR